MRAKMRIICTLKSVSAYKWHAKYKNKNKIERAIDTHTQILTKQIEFLSDLNIWVSLFCLQRCLQTLPNVINLVDFIKLIYSSYYPSALLKTKEGFSGGATEEPFLRSFQ